MNAKPAIALQRREEAVAKFTHKIEALEALLSEGKLDGFPGGSSISAFARWADKELGVSPISRSVIYASSDEYLLLRNRMDHLLERVAQLRAKGTKREIAESSLRQRLNDAEARATAYVNQYSTVMAELVDARKKIKQLEQKIARDTADRLKVFPLREIARSDASEV